MSAGISGGTVSQQQVDTLWRYLSAESREYADTEVPEDGKVEAKLLRKQQQQQQQQQAADAAALLAKGGGRGGQRR